ncbi:uncharacterized protein M421DRAFT_416647 [Didymella exigua CBS 183.55]|uniref:Non-structural maintenance of chromosomes element 1 homolog n=1 Tax=Didymella exigua CBS 183.55 TaxID=1150837 RepID=A0A6A5S6D1_9PLEO|nr:uncharacterized protein M421DRAFT_416647 [Didymella exigua CBS 183.55]KAF1933057.1 hypothetical protein M421DRAFT_416647 [Didymella exigua CBS 183.55]
MTLDEFKPVLASIMTAHNPDRPFLEGDVTQSGFITPMLQTINARLEPYNYEIRHGRNQISKEITYALVNKTSDAMTQLATRFSASEIAYIRRLLDAMFETHNTAVRETMALKQMEASNLARPRRSRQSQAASVADAADSQAPDTGITIAEADAVLNALVQDGWLQLSKAGYYSLAPRALMELHSYLKETYNEAAEDEDDEPTVRIRDCEGCREIVTYGVRCNNRECGVRWHDRCANQYYSGRRAEGKKCPQCRTVCGGNVYVGERADRVARRNSSGGGGGEEVMDDEDE